MKPAGSSALLPLLAFSRTPEPPRQLLLVQEGWLAAEVWDASRQLEAACDAYTAWQPAAEQLLAVAGGEADLVPDTPRSR